MATIVRIKRRRDEDPLEILLLANKKPKNDIPNEAVFIDPDDKNSFKFAGTVSSKVIQNITYFRVVYFLCALIFLTKSIEIWL
jgi:hypothetical protein